MTGELVIAQLDILVLDEVKRVSLIATASKVTDLLIQDIRNDEEPEKVVALAVALGQVQVIPREEVKNSE